MVTAACLALTAGAGSVGRAVLGGAAAGAATDLWRSKVQKTQKFSWGSLVRDSVVGGAVGALTAGLGSVAAPVVRRGTAAVAAAASRAAGAITSGARAAAATVRSRVATAVAAGADRGSVNFFASAGRGGATANTAVDGMAGVRAAGVAGKQAAGITKNTRRIPSLSGKVAYRVPDELTNTTLGEAKNVARSSYTNQFRDVAAYAQREGLQLDLYVRQSTVVSQPVEDAVKAGQINLIRSLP
ncbi:putative toxin [Cellulomonas sp. NPDC058312]|uniref:putative toxin n=1 Tax=Cellulomonas sp. NPDC058312 TaxID=3346441 RepID=UPI0036F01739